MILFASPFTPSVCSPGVNVRKAVPKWIHVHDGYGHALCSRRIVKLKTEVYERHMRMMLHASRQRFSPPVMAPAPRVCKECRHQAVSTDAEEINKILANMVLWKVMDRSVYERLGELLNLKWVGLYE